ncbi:MAG: hypothetical protein U0M60_14750, partial [Clostridia bacterium]|nr:hypothetical protein [Clostridia bacterium]
TKPFAFEGKTRMLQAEAGIEKLKDYVDSLIKVKLLIFVVTKVRKLKMLSFHSNHSCLIQREV